MNEYIKILDGDNLAEALIQCQRNARYKVGVVFNNLFREKEFGKYVQECTVNDPNILYLSSETIKINNGLGGTIHFGNGSVIETIHTIRPLKGKKYNRLLFDYNANYDIIGSFSEALVPYSLNNPFSEIIEEECTDVLDAFLDSFHIL